MIDIFIYGMEPSKIGCKSNLDEQILEFSRQGTDDGIKIVLNTKDLINLNTLLNNRLSTMKGVKHRGEGRFESESEVEG